MGDLKHRYEGVWEQILDSLEITYPTIASRVVGWYPNSKDEIVIRLESGDRYIYNAIDQNLYLLQRIEDEPTYISEDKFRENFTEGFRRRKPGRVINQEELSKQTGISRVMLSKYFTGKSTPSLYNAYKIARALKCSIDDLFDLRESKERYY